MHISRRGEIDRRISDLLLLVVNGSATECETTELRWLQTELSTLMTRCPRPLSYPGKQVPLLAR